MFDMSSEFNPKEGDYYLCIFTCGHPGTSYTKNRIYRYERNNHWYPGTASMLSLDDHGTPNGFFYKNFICLGSSISDLEKILYCVGDKC